MDWIECILYTYALIGIIFIFGIIWMGCCCCFHSNRDGFYCCECCNDTFKLYCPTWFRVTPEMIEEYNRKRRQENAMIVYDDCPWCDGNGVIRAKPCRQCNGSGSIVVRNNVVAHVIL